MSMSTAAGRQLREMRRNEVLRGKKSARLLRLDHMWPDVIEQFGRAMVSQAARASSIACRAPEEPPA